MLGTEEKHYPNFMKYIAILIFTLLSMTANAQEKKWTLTECMQYAVEHSPRINKQEAQVSILKQDYKEAIGRLLPSLQGNANANINFGRNLDSETNTYTETNSFSNTYNVNSSLLLFDGLSAINRVKMQKVNRLTGRQQLDEVRDMIAYETMESYFTVLYNKERVTLAEQQLVQSTENLVQIKRMEELGVKGFPDVAEMQAQQAADNYNLTRQRNVLTISMIQLKEKMNFPIEETLDVAGYNSDRPIAKTEETALNIFEQSLSFLPKALAAESSALARKLAYRSAKGGLYPTLSASAGLSTNFSKLLDGSNFASFGDQFKGKRGYYVGLSVSIPIFQGFSKSAQVQRSRFQLVIAENEKEETLRTLYAEIEQAVTDMNGQVDEYHQALRQTEAMGVADLVNQRKYKEGMINAIELHTSNNRLLQAKIEELNAQLRFYLKRRLVEYYMGVPLINE